MAKQIQCPALINLLKRYNKDLDWLAGLCGATKKDLQTLLTSKKSKLSELQSILQQGGISLNVDIRGEEAPPEGSPRMQFLKNNLTVHRNGKKIIFDVTRKTNTPECWWEEDDITLEDLLALETYFGFTLRWNFKGLSDETDVMTKIPDKGYNKKTTTLATQGFENVEEPQPVEEPADPAVVTIGGTGKTFTDKQWEDFQREYIWIFQLYIWEGCPLGRNFMERFPIRDFMKEPYTVKEFENAVHQDGRILTFRFESMAVIPQKYAETSLGFIYGLIDKNRTPADNWLTEALEKDDLPANEASLLRLTNKFQETVTISLREMPDDEQTTMKTTTKATSSKQYRPTEGKTAALTPQPAVPAAKRTYTRKTTQTTQRPAAKRTATAAEWLRAQPEYKEFLKRTSLDDSGVEQLSRYGENAISAAMAFGPGDDKWIRLSVLLRYETASGHIKGQSTIPDLDIKIRLEANSRYETRWSLINDIADNLKNTTGHYTMTLGSPIRTTDGRNIIAIGYRPDDKMPVIILIEKAGLFRSNKGTEYPCEQASAIVNLLDTEVWYDILIQSRSHFDKWGAAKRRKDFEALRANTGKVLTALSEAHNAARANLIGIVAEASQYGYLDDFSEMYHDHLYASPKISEGKVSFTVLGEDGENTADESAFDDAGLVWMADMMLSAIEKKLNP